MRAAPSHVTATLAIAAAIASGISLATPDARAAGDKDSCASASEDAQRLQRQGKLLAARQQLLTCTRSSCPAVVKQDCDGWLPTLEAMIPSLVVAARDEEGRDVVGVTVTLDGVVIDTASGRAVMLDPGMHTLHVESAGKVPTDQQIVVHEGERARPVTVTLLAKDRPVKPPPPPLPPPQRQLVFVAPPPQTSPFVWVLGTLAGVSAASFAIFEIKAVSDAAHLRSTCAPHCPQSEVDSVSTEGVVANVSIVLAAAFAGGAIAVWLTGRSPAAAPAAALVMGPGQLGVRGAF